MDDKTINVNDEIKKTSDGIRGFLHDHPETVLVVAAAAAYIGYNHGRNTTMRDVMAMAAGME